MTLVYGTMSSKGGAGKSTIAMTIAGEYAIHDKKVLLVDSDPSENLKAWWRKCEQREMQPENVDFVSALHTNTIEDIIRRKSDYDVIIIDTAGRESVVLTNILNYADVIVTPVQPAPRVFDAMVTAMQIVDEHNGKTTRKVKHFVLRTKITAINQKSDDYKNIRGYIEREVQAGRSDCILLNGELFERNIYKDIEHGFGTVQMQDLTEPVKKARIEVMGIMAEIEKHLTGEAQEAA